MTYALRTERPADAAAISALITEAFREAPHRSGTEAAIVEGLRRDGGLLVSLVAEEAGAPIGHVAASPALVGESAGWAGIGPLAVLPARQGRGAGGALLAAALDRLRATDHAGAVLVGDPAYYGRFGFTGHPGLTVARIPPEYVLALAFGPAAPRGEVRFHPAFGLA